MKSAVGRVLLFHELAEGLLQYVVGPEPDIVALSVGKQIDAEDKISLASAVCRVLAKSSQHIELYRAKGLNMEVISRHAVIDSESRRTSEILNIVNKRRKSQANHLLK